MSTTPILFGENYVEAFKFFDYMSARDQVHSMKYVSAPKEGEKEPGWVINLNKGAILSVSRTPPPVPLVDPKNTLDAIQDTLDTLRDSAQQSLDNDGKELLQAPRFMTPRQPSTPPIEQRRVNPTNQRTTTPFQPQPQNPAPANGVQGADWTQ